MSQIGYNCRPSLRLGRRRLFLARRAYSTHCTHRVLKKQVISQIPDVYFSELTISIVYFKQIVFHIHPHITNSCCKVHLHMDLGYTNYLINIFLNAFFKFALLGARIGQSRICTQCCCYVLIRLFLLFEDSAAQQEEERS